MAEYRPTPGAALATIGDAEAYLVRAARLLVQTGNRRVGQAQFFQYPVAMLEISLADLGETKAAGAPVQQPDSEVTFEAGDGLAHP